MEGLSVKIAKMRYPNANGSGDLIEDVSFDVAPRERVAFIGRSGAGKTTLLRIVAGLERCFQGSVMLDGQALDGPVRSVQLLFQDNRLLPWKTAFENVAFATDDPKGVTNAEQVMLALGRVGLQDRADAWPKNLSGGEAARVAIARALIASPRLLLLDEPFQNLDSITRLEVERQLLAALETVKPMMLLVSHDVQDAVFLSDTVHILSYRPMRINNTQRILLPHPRRRESDELRQAVAEVTLSLSHTVGAS